MSVSKLGVLCVLATIAFYLGHELAVAYDDYYGIMRSRDGITWDASK